MGVELFDMPWVAGVQLFFSYLAWTLYAVGLVVAVFESAIEYQSGRAGLKDLALGSVKGFLAAGLFSTVPVELFSLCTSLQVSLTTDLTHITGTNTGISLAVTSTLNTFSPQGTLLSLFTVILMGYAVIKVFFASLKRGGILLIQIAVGSLYMFSVPRGYIDGFTGWCKQVIGICLTAFLQSTVLVAGLMVWNQNMLLGLGLMLSATEIPRIAGHFGVDTSTKANIMSAVYATQQAVNITKTVVAAVAK